MNDRLIGGAIAGGLGAFAQILYGYSTKNIGLTDRAFHEFGKAFIMSIPYNGFLADFTGFISHLGNGVIFGILFAYIIYVSSSRYYLIKGAIYGMALWHIFLGLGTAFKMPMFGSIPPSTALATLVGSIIYGLVTAYVLRILDLRTDLV